MKSKALVPLGLALVVLPGRALGQYGTDPQPSSGPYGNPAPGPYGGQPTPAPAPYGTQPAPAPYGTQPAQGPYGAPPASGVPPSDPDSARTEQRLDEAEEADSGRGLEFFYLDAEVGFEHLGLQTFSSDNLVDSEVVDTTQTGLLVGAGAGLRLVFLTVGPRFRLASFSEYQVWTLNLELGLRIPLGSIEPYFTLGGGYASLGSFDAKALSESDVSVSGYDIRAGGGVDMYLTPVFSVGARFTGELVGLTRSGVTLKTVEGAEVQARAQEIFAADGSSTGFGISGTAVLGLHF